MLTMAVDCFPVHVASRVVNRANDAKSRTSTLNLTDVALRACDGSECDSLQSQMLARYAALKNVTPAQLQRWIAGQSASQRMVLRFVLETVVVDCDGSIDALTSKPFVASEPQLKAVQQYDSDGNALWRLRLPRLNTVAALDDALSSQGLSAIAP